MKLQESYFPPWNASISCYWHLDGRIARAGDACGTGGDAAAGAGAGDGAAADSGAVADTAQRGGTSVFSPVKEL